MSFLANKLALITGIANNRSIAYGIAKAMHREGAQLAFTYPNERFKERVEEIAAEFNSNIVIPCDVSSDQDIDAAFAELKKHWDHLDILVHSIAFAPTDQLDGSYANAVNREGFRVAHDISSYSLAALAKAAKPMMENHQSAIVAMTYDGSQRVLPHYNVMGVAKASLEANVRYLAHSLGALGIRVNAIAAGPVRTLAASGVKNFRKMLAYDEQIAPLKRNITVDDVGNVSAFLCSDLALGVTGEIVHVDSGVHCMGAFDLTLE
ncbi:MAG: hypothetical protein A2X77_00220 [Gammaproteobacteria bacterium GWE2_42_36]|nr:MAG: hypothetical protein A2X77_00220 [Gammaproteobacteria bacterium GWE2_42_36]HCU05034.1 enoyl-[acyl-carrier-protein] reductase FabI [Coxiellaceae bacterium]